MTTTTTSLTERQHSQVTNQAQACRDAGLTIHEADTEYGTIFFTIESRNGGHVWAEDLLVVNRLPHVLIGTYRLTYGRDNTSGVWTENLDQPHAYVGGYPG